MSATFVILYDDILTDEITYVAGVNEEHQVVMYTTERRRAYRFHHHSDAKKWIVDHTNAGYNFCACDAQVTITNIVD